MELTIQQQRAKFALERIQKLPKKLNQDEQIEFISNASRLPAMIHMNGLGQAMAFCKLKAKERKSYAQLYQIVSDWLCAQNQPYQGQEHILAGITQCEDRKSVV